MSGAIGNHYNIETFQRGYPTQGTLSFTLVANNMQVFLHSFSAFNAGGGATDIGLGIAHANPTWSLYTGNVNGGSPVNVTSTVQAGTATSIFDTTNNDGFMVESTKLFGYLTFTISQVQSGSPVYSYQYWNGVSWATLLTNQVPVYTGTGVVHLTFNPPGDWVKGDNGMGANNGYSIRVRSTTAGGQAVQITALRVAHWLCYRQTVPSVGQVQVIFDQHPKLLESGEAIVPYYSTASNLNSIEAAFQTAP